MSKLYHRVRCWLRYWLVDDVHPGYDPMRFALRGTIYVLLVIAAIVVLGICAATLVGCGPECAPAFPIVGDYPGGAGRYEFRATHRLVNGVRIELPRPDLLEELDAVVTRTLEFAAQLGPTLTLEEMDDEHGFCLAHLARNPRCDERECFRIKVLPLREAYISRIDGVTLLLRDEVDLYDDAGCWFPKPELNPDLPAHWPAGCQSDGVCVVPLPSGEYFFDEDGEPIEGVYGRWRGLARALIDYKLGCYNSVLIPRVQAYLIEVP